MIFDGVPERHRPLTTLGGEAGRSTVVPLASAPFGDRVGGIGVDGAPAPLR